MSSSTPSTLNETEKTPSSLPSLNYTLHTRSRKRNILIFWTLILLDTLVLPITLYFALFFGTHLSHNAVFSISTGALGSVSILEYFLRWWRLWNSKEEGTEGNCRPIGAGRLYFDWFHWNYSFAWMIIMIELIVGTIPREPPIRLLSMPAPTMLFTFAFELLLIDTMRLLHLRSPIRISSLPAGEPLRPGIYFIIEDIVAVDGGGGIAYRERLNERYEKSHLFRQMLHRLTLFWAGGALGMAVICTVVVFTVPSGSVAYAFGWAAPFAWAGVWTFTTIKWVQKDLKDEKEKWNGPQLERVRTKVGSGDVV